MKLTIVCLALCVALVYSETCANSHCDGHDIHTHCTDSWVVECHSSVTGNVCTCVDPNAAPSGACSDNNDCTSHHCPNNLHARCTHLFGSSRCICRFGGGK